MTEAVPVGPFGKRVYFDAASAGGRVHVAYREAGGEVHYVQRGADGTWSAPVALGGLGRPFVLADGDGVTVLVLANGLLGHVSIDGGASWSPPTPHAPSLVAWDGDVVRTTDGTYVLITAAWHSSVADEEHVGRGWAHPDIFPSGRAEGKQLDLWSLQSVDGGRTWSAPGRIGEVEYLEPRSGSPSLLYERGVRLSAVESSGSEALFAAISTGAHRGRGLASGMHLASSEDGGDTWSPLAPLAYRAAGPRLGQLFDAADVVAGSRGPLLVFNADEGLTVGAMRPDGQWEERDLWRRPIGGRQSPTYAVNGPDGVVAVVWNDERRARREWYANTVWATLFGRSGWWTQTDLFLRTLSSEGHVSEPVPLTPAGSFVWYASRPLFVSDQLCVAWSGTTNAGRVPEKPDRLYLTCHSS